MSGKEIQIIANEFILNRIYLVRGKQVMLSHDLAELYQVETKALNQQVKRNIGKFPSRYMFQLNKNEHDRLRSHFVTFRGAEHQVFTLCFYRAWNPHALKRSSK